MSTPATTAWLSWPPRCAAASPALEYYQLDDVGQGFDLLQSNPEQIVATLGHHPDDLMTSYYLGTPSDIYVECGWCWKTQ
jgi:hypothetical protein